MDKSEHNLTARAIADELRDARWRGLDDLDINNPPRKPRVELPQLERLARLHLGDEQLARIDAIKRLLRAALTSYRATNPGYATIVQQLFFGPDLEAEYVPSAGELLKVARTKANLDDKKFRERQAAIFQDFAGFLIEFVGVPHTDDVEPHSSAAPIGFWRRRSTLALVAAGGVAALAVGLVLANGGGGGSRNPPSTPPPVSHGSTGSTTSASQGGSPAAGVLRFDDLGGGSSTIYVYPGVTTTARDKVANGTFESGQTAPAKCKTNGRLITSDPSSGERSKQSTLWIEIAGVPGKRQFATYTYADVSAQTLAQLPACSNVP